MLNLAIFGAGRIGQIHARNAAAMPELTLKYVVDPNNAAADALARQTAAKVSDIDAVLGDASVAGVIIASATNAHLDQALHAAAAGKKIFCEKPLDLDLGRARQAAPQLSSARMLLGFKPPLRSSFRNTQGTDRFERHRQARDLEHHQSRSRPPPVSYIRDSGGLFKDMTIHDFDMARWLLGEEPSEVFAAAGCLVDPAIAQAGDVDTARIVLRTRTGKLSVISNTRRSGYGYDQRIEAFGSAGCARADNVVMSTVSTITERGSQSDALQNFFLDRYAEAYRREMRHFLDILHDAAAPAVGYSDGIASLVLAEAAALSVKRNAPVLTASI